MILSNAVIGGGLTGLLISVNRGYTVIEEQPHVGGVLSTFQLDNISLTLAVPLVNTRLDFLEQYGARFRQIKFDISINKEKYFAAKICPFCDEIPDWLFPKSENMFLIENVSTVLSNIEKKVHIMKDSAKIIDKKGILTKYHGLIQIEGDIINTTSIRLFLRDRGKDVSNLKYNNALLSVFISKKKADQNFINLEGGSSTSFSHVYHINDFPSAGLSSIYVYSFFDIKDKIIDIYRLLSDLRREKILNYEDIISQRSKVISEAILYGSPENTEDYIFEGRLGRWRNYSIEQIVEKYSHY
ncbi:NAD(P)-binding protein [Sulfuracidifex tepidarius]|uniref:Uncharacterized protein n=1 Tax=Sulfuracidifex tepidarius TaxID=1294262 RepID=A0A510DWJ7_9CREN|nr:FAD/NAD(P)-binding protein [Sulfuracidifex tepidarius]BBG24569.1 hypothetical protein IC006_1896 [Sulfuracidifex tepidarius]BBG27357.1 hypothetical protein IC007_1904 [Sulfuracidifex tepidarius]